MEQYTRVRTTPGMRPSGVVVYPKNNGRLKTLVLYKDIGGKTGYLWGEAKAKEKGSPHAIYPVALDATGPRGPRIKVGALKGLDKTNTPARVYDPETWKEIGYFRWEEVKLPGGSQRERPDSTGEFQLIASTFKRLYGADTYGFGNVHDDVDDSTGDGEQTRKNFLDMLDGIRGANLDYFAFAGHGNWDSLASAQIRKQDVEGFVERLRRIVRPDGAILFYACLTGKDGGLASKVSQGMRSASVWGHTRKGTASRNDDKIVYRNGFGVPIKDKLSAAAAKNLSAYLLSSEDFYARMPFMSVPDMNAEIEAFAAAKKK